MGRKNTIAKPISGGLSLSPAPVLNSSAVPVSSVSAPQSPPGMPPQPPPGVQVGGMDPLSGAIMWLNTNPYLIGMLMLLLNLGGRFLALELTKKQEAFLQASWVRPMIFFTVIFIATRNLVAAFWVTLLFFFIIWVAANENSPFCMIPSWCGHDIKTPAEVYESNVASLGR
jgi:hypothetical protein